MSDDAWMLPGQRSLPEVIAERIVEAIRTGTLKPGERIVEAALARKLNVSRAPLREALKHLEASQLVERRHNHGTFVAQVTKERALELVILRATLEGLAARLVAARRTEEMLAAFSAQTDRMRELSAAQNVDAWREADWQFHEMLCRASGNDLLLRSWLSISLLVRLSLLGNPDFDLEPDQIIRNHVRMLAVLRSGTPDEADAAFRSMILSSGLRTLGIAPPPELASLIGVDGLRGSNAPPAPRGRGVRRRAPIRLHTPAAESPAEATE